MEFIRTVDHTELNSWFNNCLRRLIDVYPLFLVMNLMVENNPMQAGQFASVTHCIASSKGYRIESRHQRADGKLKEGIVTTQHNKVHYIMLTTALLERNAICFAENVVSGLGSKNAIEKLLEEMSVYRIISKLNDFDGNAAKTTFTGKGSSGNGDDIVCALIQGLYHGLKDDEQLASILKNNKTVNVTKKLLTN